MTRFFGLLLPWGEEDDEEDDDEDDEEETEVCDTSEESASALAERSTCQPAERAHTRH